MASIAEAKMLASKAKAVIRIAQMATKGPKGAAMAGKAAAVTAAMQTVSGKFGDVTGLASSAKAQRGVVTAAVNSYAKTKTAEARSTAKTAVATASAALKTASALVVSAPKMARSAMTDLNKLMGLLKG